MNFADLRFAEPRWLWLAAAAPVLLALLHRHAVRRRHEQLARMASPHFVAELTASHSPARRRVKEILLLLAPTARGVPAQQHQQNRCDHRQTEPTRFGKMEASEGHLRLTIDD